MLRTFYPYHKKDNEIDLMCGYKGLYVILPIIFTAISSLKSIFLAIFISVIIIMILPQIFYFI